VNSLAIHLPLLHIHKIQFLLLLCLLAALIAGLPVKADDGENKARLWQVYQEKKGSYPVRTEHLRAGFEPLYINRLINESSPYLLLHAHNPIDWYAWGEEAFKRARLENKPVFLSIGYSTCHWCHVMAYESFDDEIIGKLLNHGFVSIKVDRERRPEVDSIYMKALELSLGYGGWPMTLILTPDGKPFYTAVYISPDELHRLLQQV